MKEFTVKFRSLHEFEKTVLLRECNHQKTVGFQEGGFVSLFKVNDDDFFFFYKAATEDVRAVTSEEANTWLENFKDKEDARLLLDEWIRAKSLLNAGLVDTLGKEEIAFIFKKAGLTR